MRIYLAARYTRHEELQEYAKQLEELGHIITSRWIQGGHQIDDKGLSTEAKAEERTRFAEEDLSDVISASCIINFTEEPRTTNSRGGRHVEFGIGIGRRMILIVVGPRENVFHCLKEVRYFSTWDEALVHIKEWP